MTVIKEMHDKEMHVALAARNRYNMATSLFSYTGDLIVADYRKVQDLTERMNRAKPKTEHIASSELYAAGLLHEVQHALIDAFNQQQPEFVAVALATLKQNLGSDAYTHTLINFLDHFPTTAIYSNELNTKDYLETIDVTNSTTGEEMLILKLSNDNPALAKFSELLDDSSLKATAYEVIAEGIEKSVSKNTTAIEGLVGLSLSEVLRNPIKASPDSLEGQLRFIEKTYAPHLSQHFQKLFQQVVLSLDLFKEEYSNHVDTQYSGPPAPPPMPVMDEAMLSGRAAGMEEYEHFSSDSVWMPNLVLLAKSTYVWLDQLSKRYQKDISKLDDIPEEELATFASQGFSGLWLIGLWERSHASKEIKHRMGNPDAVASAYSLYDYEIAEDLGGQAAYNILKERAWQHGIRLASDMVPNHMGIDSRWVIEHPEWFLSVEHPPYPTYRFESEDLSTDSRVSIKIEDHYYSKSDASVVFERRDNQTGEVRYIYHGNDGTTMPWNDTAQLNYLDPQVREAIIQTILHVARQFPIIRFDAAMTLAKRHIQRLWYPQPGSGGAIPSRAQHGGMTTDAFEAAIPEEFWREVVDRVAQEVPDTLLLAEAFWMMEGYFVRTLGMHRVYNSAFMHMLAQEDNAKYRQSIKNVLEFEPEILKRYVNFMNNPDEESAATQFGKSDKYFGVAMLMSTLPGLPMFGHGQFEGLEEKYGMEFRRARKNESVDTALFEHHYSVIVPLLKHRKLFAEVENFLLYDFYTESGQVEENVFAYSNKLDTSAALILFNNQYADVKGWLKDSCSYSEQEPTGLSYAIGLDAPKGGFLLSKEVVSGKEYLQPVAELAEKGWYFELGPYGHRCYWQFEQVYDSETKNYTKLYEQIGTSGVDSIAIALQNQYFEPIQLAFSELLKVASEDNLSVEKAYEGFIASIETSKLSKAKDLNAVTLESFEQAKSPTPFKALVEALNLSNTELSPEFQLAYLALHEQAPKDVKAWRCLEASKGQLSTDDIALLAILLSGDLERTIDKEKESEHSGRVLRRWLEPTLSSPPIAHFLRINQHEGISYFHKESLESFCAALSWLNSFNDANELTLKLPNKLLDASQTSDYQVNKLLDALYPEELYRKKTVKHDKLTRNLSGNLKK